MAAEQAEAKRKTKVEKARATKEVAEDAAPAPKEEAPVIIWPGLISDSGRLGSAWKAQAAPLEPQMSPVACVASRDGSLCAALGVAVLSERNASADHASSPCNAHPLNFLI